MDLVDWDEQVFERIEDELTDWAARLDIWDITFIPISALHGDNVVERSQEMGWYGGPPLLYHLEHVVIATDRNLDDVRVPVQWVVRVGGAGSAERPASPERADAPERSDYRGYAGQVAAGVLRPGDEVAVLPAGTKTRVAAIDAYEGELDAAFPTMSITLRLADELDVSRGDMIVNPDDPPVAAKELEAMVCWMGSRPLEPDARYALKHTTRSVRAVVDELEYQVDVNTLEHVDAGRLELNEIGRVKLRLTAPVMVDRYRRNRTIGSFILIDEASGDTVGAGMVLHASSA
jgi:bifunctional enzyme CysN/CysC